MSDKELVSVEKAVEAQVTHLSLIKLAVEKGADITQIERLLDLQERHEASQAKKSFDLAMSQFQSEIPAIGKNGEVDYTSAKGRTHYEYAKIEDIAKAIKPALKNAGLSYRFTQSQTGGLICVTCIVTHKDGHTESSSLSSSPDASGGKDQLKATASAITYLRRYTMTGILGVVVGGEDNDSIYEQSEDQQKEKPKLTPASKEGWRRAIESCKTYNGLSEVLKHCEVSEENQALIRQAAENG